MSASAYAIGWGITFALKFTKEDCITIAVETINKHLLLASLVIPYLSNGHGDLPDLLPSSVAIMTTVVLLLHLFWRYQVIFKTFLIEENRFFLFFDFHSRRSLICFHEIQKQKSHQWNKENESLLYI